MPISAKINHEINQLDADSSFKKMMTDILKREDEGLTQKTYKAEYQAIVDAFIECGGKQNESSTN